jgi:glycosyltransferase involved in cell wall biosynthesis
MRICFVSHSAGRGGAEKALLELIAGLRERGVECRCVLPREGPLVEALLERGAEASVVPYAWWTGRDRSPWKRARRGFRTLRALPALSALIRSWKSDIVYTNTVTICAGALAARLGGRRHVWHIHEFGYEDHGLNFDWGTALSLGAVDRLSAACIVNSRAVAAHYGGRVDPAKIHVVDYAVDVEPALSGPPRVAGPRENGVLRCAIVGALTPGKRQEDAITALHRVTRAGVPAELVVVGEGKEAYTARLRGLVEQYGLSGRVRFTGQVDNPRTLVDAADVVLMCSMNEAFGRVTVEAMKAAKPVIGSRSGGTPEIIRDGETGLLYTPADAEELAQKILYLHAHPGAGRAMGERGRSYAETRFTRQRYSGAILDILTRVLDGTGR